MSFTAFAICFIVIAGLMALWVDSRFPGLAPDEVMPAVWRLAGVFVLSQVAIPATTFLASSMSETTRGALVIAIGFAATTLVMLATIWMVKVAQGLLSGRFR